MRSHLGSRTALRILILIAIVIFLALLLRDSVANQVLGFSDKHRFHTTHECFDNSCIFTNLCLFRNNSFVYLSPKDTQLPNLPRMSLYSATQDFFNKAETEVPSFISSSFDLVPQNITWITGTTYVQNLLAVGNFGHTILQNVLPVIAASQFLPHFAANGSMNVLVMNNCDWECGAPSPKCPYTQGSFAFRDCAWQRDTIYSFFFDKYPLQVSSLFQNNLTGGEGSNEAFYCMDRAVIGFGAPRIDFLAEESDRELRLKVVQYARDLAYEKLKTSHNFSLDRINIVVYCKKGGLVGDPLGNCNLPGKIMENHNNTYKSFAVNVSVVNFEQLKDFDAQLRIISSADIYIADGGASGYYSNFLRNGTVFMFLPKCNTWRPCFCHLEVNEARQFSHIKSVYIPPEYITYDEKTCGKDALILKPEFEELLMNELEYLYQARTDQSTVSESS